MNNFRAVFALAIFGLLTASAPGGTEAPPVVREMGSSYADGPALSVMTYNVHGLPFPIAWQRGPALHEIGVRLAMLRQAGRQPHIILLQEAFTADAKAIAGLAGYRYVATGPQPADVEASRRSAMSEAFDADASWSKGETEGKWVDSGLVVMSDYPISKTVTLAFPRDTCAGFDCLATKGVLLTWIKVPGQTNPIAIADTHLNSRVATGVSIERANAAFARQVATAKDFIARNVAANTSLVFGGDFNIGHDATRIAVTRQSGGIVEGASEATDVIQCGSKRHSLSEDLQSVEERAKDKQYFRAGIGRRLELNRAEVPFGARTGGNTLSDHLGYVVEYDL